MEINKENSLQPETKTNKVNPLLLVAVAVLAAAVVVAGVIWFFVANVIINGTVYPRDVEFLNLREEELTLKEYDAIRAKLPDCQLYWNIPFQGSTYPEDTRELTVTTLTDEDIAVLDYFTQLKTVHAENCKDYAQLQALRQHRGDLDVRYRVTLSGVAYDWNVTQVTLNTLTEAELPLFAYLPHLTAVEAMDCRDYTQLEMLEAIYPDLDVHYSVVLGGTAVDKNAEEVTVTGMTDEEVDYLKHLPGLKKLHLVDPEMSAENLFDISGTYPDMKLSWEVTICGMRVPYTATEVDLMAAISPEGAAVYEQAAKAPVQGRRDDTVWQFANKSKYPLPNKTAETAQLVAEVEGALEYLPDVELVNMCGVELDNEAMAAFRERRRSDYKVVWTVRLGGMNARTDTPYFMPIKNHVYYFQDHESGNLKYCEDIIAMDIGHMSVHDVSFVEYMPKLKYLILAHTQVSDITPLQHCKNVVFLELDWSLVKDYTPLQGCTALEDLNVSKTYADVTPLLSMTWLKHLWILDRGLEAQMSIRGVFEETETVLFFNGEFSVSGGWRDLPNYYAMRDILGMPYM